MRFTVLTCFDSVFLLARLRIAVHCKKPWGRRGAKLPVTLALCAREGFCRDVAHWSQGRSRTSLKWPDRRRIWTSLQPGSRSLLALAQLLSPPKPTRNYCDQKLF